MLETLFFFFPQAVVFGIIVIAGAFIVKYVGTMVLQVRVNFFFNTFIINKYRQLHFP